MLTENECKLFENVMADRKLIRTIVSLGIASAEEAKERIEEYREIKDEIFNML